MPWGEIVQWVFIVILITAVSGNSTRVRAVEQAISVAARSILRISPDLERKDDLEALKKFRGGGSQN